MALAQNLYVLGRIEILEEGRAAAGRKMLLQSLRTEPRQLKAWVLLISALPGASPARIVSRIRKFFLRKMSEYRRIWYRRADPFEA